MLVQQNVDGSDFFNRTWEEFKVGFNDTRGNYWLGNELLHRLTNNGNYKLRFDLLLRNDSWYYAEYSSFIVFSEAQKYRMQVSGYTGNAGNGLKDHDGAPFTTYDRDNDYHGRNCAAENGGGFWYTACSHANVNTVRGRGNDFKWFTRISYIYLRSTRMWLMC